MVLGACVCFLSSKRDKQQPDNFHPSTHLMRVSLDDRTADYEELAEVPGDISGAARGGLEPREERGGLEAVHLDLRATRHRIEFRRKTSNVKTRVQQQPIRLQASCATTTMVHSACLSLCSTSVGEWTRGTPPFDRKELVVKHIASSRAPSPIQPSPHPVSPRVYYIPPSSSRRIAASEPAQPQKMKTSAIPPTLLMIGKVTPYCLSAKLAISSQEPGSWAPNWLQGKATMASSS